MLRKYPGIFLLLVVIPGILLGDMFQVAGWVYLLPAVVVCGIGVLLLGKERYQRAVLFFGVGLFLFSAFHFSLYYVPTGSNHISNYADRSNRYHLFGTVIDWPDLRSDRTELKVALDSIGLDYNWQVKGIVLVKIPDTTTAFQRNDRLEFYGRIYPVRASKLPGGFDYQRYMRLKGVYGIVYLHTLLDIRVDTRNRYSVIALVDRLRLALTKSLNRNLSPEAAALASGFLIGETRNIPAHIYQKFRDTGTLHLLAVSGSNVALVLGFVIFLLQPWGVSKRVRGLILFVVLILFTLLSYGEPSVIRAAVMAALVIVATLVQRPYNLNNIIALTAAIIMLVDPTQLYDVGFQLSFVTAWGIIFFTPLIYNRLMQYQRHRWYRFIFFPLVVSLIAQICSAPLIAFYFHQVPVISVVANLVIVPLVSLAVIGILGVLLADIILPLLGLFAGSLVNMVLVLIIKALDMFSNKDIPILHINDISFLMVVLFYATLLLLVWSFYSMKVRRVLIIGVVVFVNIFLVWNVMGALASQACTEVWLSNVPGGTVMVIKPNESSQADMIITSLRSKEYPIDEYILVPLLRQLKINTLENIFLLSAEYDAVDDVLRLAKKMSASRFVIPAGLENSVQDIIRFSLNSVFPVDITIAGKSPADTRKIGYYPFEGGIVVNLGKEVFTVVNRLTPKVREYSSDGQSSILVVGYPVKQGNIDWDLLSEDRYPKIICSKIIHSTSKKLPSALSITDTIPKYVTDLTQAGSFYLQIPSF